MEPTVLRQPATFTSLDVGDEVLQPEEPVEGNTRDPAHICAVAVPMEPDENRVIARLEKV